MKNRNKSGFFIEATCPGCGGELELDQNFFITTCAHCGSVLRLVMPDVPPAFLVRGDLPRRELRFSMDRFLKKRNLPLTDADIQIKGIYYPFWKMDALLLKVRNRIDKRIFRAESEYQSEVALESEKTDISVTPYSLTIAAGAVFDGIPDSLGMRPGFVKLVPFSDDNISDNFDALPVISVDDIDQAAFGRNITELFHPVFSLLFFPYFIAESYQDDYRRFVIDGVTTRILKLQTPEKEYDERGKNNQTFDNFELHPKDGGFIDEIDNIDVTSESGDGSAEEPNAAEEPNVRFGRLGVEFHRCDTCGVDLPDNKSYVYICRNCHEIKTIDKTFLPIENILISVNERESVGESFPFWAFKIPEKNCESLQNLFGGIHESDRLVVPAFKMKNFEALYRLAGRISSAFPRIEFKTVESFDENFRAIDVSMDGAIAYAEILIYRKKLAESAQKTFKPSFEEEFRPEKVDLFFTPFHPQSYFFVDSVMGTITFEKNLVG